MNHKNSVMVFEGAHLAARLFAPDAQKLLVTFDHRQPNKSDFGTAVPIKTAVNRGWAVLRLMTRRNDWFVNRDTDNLEKTLSAIVARYERVHAIGFSMGGFGVFRFAQSLSIRSAIAVSPQVSIDPTVVPWDTRFRNQAGGFDPQTGSLADRPAPNLNALVLFDPFHRQDRDNAKELAALFAGVRLLRLGFAGHPSSRAIRKGGRIGVLINQALSTTPDPAPIRRAFQQTRTLMPDFWQNLSGVAAGRHPALHRPRQQSVPVSRRDSLDDTPPSA